MAQDQAALSQLHRSDPGRVLGQDSHRLGRVSFWAGDAVLKLQLILIRRHGELWEWKTQTQRGAECQCEQRFPPTLRQPHTLDHAVSAAASRVLLHFLSALHFNIILHAHEQS
jgi:hypothetical protein